MFMRPALRAPILRSLLLPRFLIPGSRILAFTFAWIATLPPALRAQDNRPATVDFNVPAGEAGPALKQFALQAKREVMFPAKPLRGITTKAVQGNYSAKEGLDLLLEGTELIGFIDQKTGAVVVQRSNDPNVERAARTSDRPRIQSLLPRPNQLPQP